MVFDPELAAIRFGTGLSPVLVPPASAAEVLTRLVGPDEAAQAHPIETWGDFGQRLIRAEDLAKARRRAETEAAKSRARKAIREMNGVARRARADWVVQMLARRISTRDGLRERLAQFWTDHFTVQGKFGVLRRGVLPYAESALRPHLAGRFADLLIAATTAPMMLHYLDQAQSVGPNAPAARGRRGLNENLARELLELHTLGAGGAYGQKDVRQLAELLTGVTFSFREGAHFAPRMAEPGAEDVLGRHYGGGEPARLSEVTAALEDLARHPDTARHLCRKLAVHFVSDEPDPALIGEMTSRYRDTDGLLAEVYAVMLDHPASWRAPLAGNVKPPVDFIASSFRALGLAPAALPLGDEKAFTTLIAAPLAQMGQPWEEPTGPDGWPEEDASWITPQRYAARLQWLAAAPLLLMPDLPDPRRALADALGSLAPEPLRFAVAAAQTRAEGLTIALAAPAFQRM